MPHDLIHTPLRLPHDRLRVTSLRTLDHGRGVAYSADLTLDGRLIGRITHEGTGGDAQLEKTGWGPRKTNEWVEELARSSCFVRPGVTRRPWGWMVLEALVSEYEWPEVIRQQASRGLGVIRAFAVTLETSDGTTRPFRLRSGETSPQTLTRVREGLDRGDLVLPQLRPEVGEIWQLWTGSVWQDLT